MKSPANKGWIASLSSDDYEQLWSRLYTLISSHPSVRILLANSGLPYAQLAECYADFTQDVFLELQRKQRWQFYLASGYRDEDVEHEMSHIEIPNMVGAHLRERFPESFRLARRVSQLLNESERFQKYRRVTGSNSGNGASSSRKRGSGKQLFGLSEWPPDKPMKDDQLFAQLIRDVHFRKRRTKRSGRVSFSQVIIPNSQLVGLIVDVLRAIDSPADVRSLRKLVLSKLPIEDSSFISIEEKPVSLGGPEGYSIKREFADGRPTPEEMLSQKEFAYSVNDIVTGLLSRLQLGVNYKQGGYNLLLKVVWHCFFDDAMGSQTAVARRLGISNSLVVHYRKIFHAAVQETNLKPDEWSIFIAALRNRLSVNLTESAERVVEAPRKRDNAAESVSASGGEQIRPKKRRRLRARPPKAGEYLLYFLLTKQDRSNIIGDLEEEYKLIEKKFARRPAIVWYYKQVFSSIGPIVWKRLVGWGIFAWIGEWIRRHI